MTTRLWLSANSSRYKDREALIAACMKAVKVQRDSVLLALNQQPLKTSSNDSISVDEFRARHDPLFKLRAACKRLKKGELFVESVFRENIAKINSMKFRSKADQHEFEAYKGRAGGKIYWGNPAVINNLKAEGLLL